MSPLRRWTWPLGWALLILAASSIPGRAVPETIVGLDKVVHAALYGVLGLLCWRAALETPRLVNAAAIISWLMATTYGAVNELYQDFVPGRDWSLSDLGADALGAALGIALGAWWMRRRA